MLSGNCSNGTISSKLGSCWPEVISPSLVGLKGGLLTPLSPFKAALTGSMILDARAGIAGTTCD